MDVKCNVTLDGGGRSLKSFLTRFHFGLLKKESKIWNLVYTFRWQDMCELYHELSNLFFFFLI